MVQSSLPPRKFQTRGSPSNNPELSRLALAKLISAFADGFIAGTLAFSHTSSKFPSLPSRTVKCCFKVRRSFSALLISACLTSTSIFHDSSSCLFCSSCCVVTGSKGFVSVMTWKGQVEVHTGSVSLIRQELLNIFVHFLKILNLQGTNLVAYRPS
jgi:hypothetical protein